MGIFGGYGLGQFINNNFDGAMNDGMFILCATIPMLIICAFSFMTLKDRDSKRLMAGMALLTIVFVGIGGLFIVDGLAEQVPPETSVITETVTETVPNQLWQYCENCGTKIVNENANYCSGCGSELG